MIFLFIRKLCNYRLAACLLIIVLLFSCLSITQAQQIEHVSITVSNLEKSVSFYKEILSFTEVSNQDKTKDEVQQLFRIIDPKLGVRSIKLKLGDEVIELMEFIGAKESRKIPTDSKSNDLWFQHIAIVVSDMDSAYSVLKKSKVIHVSASPQTLPAYINGAAGIKAFYFRDPDGHNLELINFPRGKGNRKWQGRSNLFLGIDHTAITVSGTVTGLTFYTAIGFNVAGHSENYGPEQEQLNQVLGARLGITGLRGTSGFGLELLDYEVPQDGREYPKDTRPSDLIYWHTSIKVRDLDKIGSQLGKLNYQIVCKGNIDTKGSKTFLEKFILMRDGDGHFVLLSE